MSFPSNKPTVKDFRDLLNHANEKNVINIAGALIVSIANYEKVDRYTIADSHFNQVVATVFVNRNGVKAKMAIGVWCWAAYSYLCSRQHSEFEKLQDQLRKFG